MPMQNNQGKRIFVVILGAIMGILDLLSEEE